MGVYIPNFILCCIVEHSLKCEWCLQAADNKFWKSRDIIPRTVKMCKSDCRPGWEASAQEVWEGMKDHEQLSFERSGQSEITLPITTTGRKRVELETIHNSSSSCEIATTRAATDVISTQPQLRGLEADVYNAAGEEAYMVEKEKEDETGGCFYCGGPGPDVHRVTDPLNKNPFCDDCAFQCECSLYYPILLGVKVEKNLYCDFCYEMRFGRGNDIPQNLPFWNAGDMDKQWEEIGKGTDKVIKCAEYSDKDKVYQ